MGDLTFLFFFLAFFILILLHFDYRDGIKFPCLFASDREKKREPNFVYSTELDTFVNRSGVEACVEDVVNFVNKRRRGADGAVGTKDDDMSFEQQVSLLSAMLQANFHGGFWAQSPWFLKYDEGRTVFTKVLYADCDEYLLISGSRTSSAGRVYEPHVAKSVFGLEGKLRIQRHAPFRPVVVGPLLNRASGGGGESIHIEDVGTSEGELWSNGFRLKKGEKFVFSTADGEGSFTLQYGYGAMPYVSLWSFILPSLFKAWDWRTALTSIRVFSESFYRNGILPVIALIFDKEEAWTTKLNLSYLDENNELYAEEVYKEESETGEDVAAELSLRKAHEEQEDPSSSSSSSTTPSGKPTQDNAKSKEKSQSSMKGKGSPQQASPDGKRKEGSSSSTSPSKTRDEGKEKGGVKEDVKRRPGEDNSKKNRVEEEDEEEGEEEEDQQDEEDDHLARSEEL
ncbi:transmembrane protein [Cystoisospora suis]|uniref:Transmembrane protein n=1 Tax=Cystoisospora suis TaxID=483139 RepID=A0A2C6KS43_9APIC|nr:transmembrane protein [Cystoisospora suis]